MYGTMEEPDWGWRPAADRCSVLVHCAVEYSEKSWTSTVPRSAHCGTPGATASDGSSSPPAASGAHGDSGDGAIDESAPLDRPMFVALRPAVDAAVLSWNGGGFRTLVIRPGCVYGGAGEPDRLLVREC